MPHPRSETLGLSRTDWKQPFDVGISVDGGHLEGVQLANKLESTQGAKCSEDITRHARGGNMVRVLRDCKRVERLWIDWGDTIESHRAQRTTMLLVACKLKRCRLGDDPGADLIV
jgi:hypothetical protein